MTLNLNVPETEGPLAPRITVVGVGGAGGNAVNNMIKSNLEGVEFLVANTDSQALTQSLCERTLQLGRNITQGLGSGSRPDIGRAAAEEALEDIMGDLSGAHMVFITAGMGGGTGTGGAPVIARAAREQGILTVGVVTKPFQFEGVHRMRIAEAGINELTQYVDTLIIIPNQNLFRIANEKTTFADAFKMADDVLHAGVRGVTDLMVMPGLINLDFADIRTVMTEMGKAMMGTGEAEGDNRAIAAAEAAISNPLLEDVSMKGARGVLINITGGPDLTLFEVDEAANRIREEVDPEANIIFGSTYDDKMEGHMRVSVVSTGIDADESAKPRPVTLSLVQGSGNANEATGAAAGSSLEPVAGGEASAPVEAEAAATTQTMIRSAVPSEPTPQTAQPVEDNEEPLELTIPSDGTAETGSLQKEQDASPGTEMGDAFIAPPPMEPEVAVEEPSPRTEEPSPRTEEPAPRVAAPDTFAAANLEDAPKPAVSPQESVASTTRTRAQTIFARMSGAARALHAAAQGPDNNGRNKPAPKPVQAVEPAAVEVEVRETGAPPRLSGLDPTERVSSNPVEDDLLDIPAFLRRQAN